MATIRLMTTDRYAVSFDNNTNALLSTHTHTHTHSHTHTQTFTHTHSHTHTHTHTPVHTYLFVQKLDIFGNRLGTIRNR